MFRSAATLTSMKNNLVPERRTDKNGVTSTRWVKPATDTGAGSALIPAPSPVTPSLVVDAAMINDAAELFVSEIVEGVEERYDAQEYLKETVEVFSSFPSGLIEDLLSPVKSPYMKMLGLKILIEESGADHALMRDFVNHSDFLEDCDFIDADRAISFLSSAVQRHGELEPLSLTGEYPQNRKQQVESLVTGFMWLDMLDDERYLREDVFRYEEAEAGRLGPPVIVDEALGKLLVERADQIDRITDFMRDRKSADVEALKVYLDHDEHVMSDGVL